MNVTFTRYDYLETLILGFLWKKANQGLNLQRFAWNATLKYVWQFPTKDSFNVWMQKNVCMYKIATNEFSLSHFLKFNF